MDLAFLLVNEAEYPDPKRVIAAGKKLGLILKHEAGSTNPMSFDLKGGGTFMVMLIDAPHPDVPTMAVAPTSPAAADATAAKAHFVLTAMDLVGEPRERDTVMAKLATTVIENVDAVGAMLGHGVVFHRADLFAEMSTAAVEEGELPAEVAVSVTAASEGKDRMSFLTHGMQRYGREELYLTCGTKEAGALEFVFMLTRWMLADLEKKFATGETIGRTAKEKLKIQRVENPTGRGPKVIRLDLGKR